MESSAGGLCHIMAWTVPALRRVNTVVQFTWCHPTEMCPLVSRVRSEWSDCAGLFI